MEILTYEKFYFKLRNLKEKKKKKPGQVFTSVLVSGFFLPLGPSKTGFQKSLITVILLEKNTVMETGCTSLH